MGYEKPGVSVRQQQVSNTPVLITPELEACVVGHSYKWIDPTLESSIVGTATGGEEFITVLKDNNADYYNVKSDEPLVIVDLLGISGAAIGSVKHLLYNVDYTVDSTTVGTEVTINAAATTAGSNYQVRIGYRAKDSKVSEGFKTLVSISDIEEVLGEIVTWNPLAYGTKIAMENSANSINVLKINVAETGVIGASDVLDKINNYLGQQEVYAIAAMTHKIVYAGLKTHCEVNSSEIEKKERVAFVNNVITYTNDPKTLTTSDKVTLAESLRDEASTVQNKRVYIVRPDAGYVLETRHIATLSPAWIAASFAGTTTLAFDTNKLYAKFVSDVTINGTKYKAGTLIDATLWGTLLNSGWGGSTGMVDVLVPVPGYYYTAQAVGQVIGTPISQPLTNVAGSGFVETFGSQDIFTESQLNTIAEGGNWIYTQDGKTNPIYCRHQLSSDMTSVAKRELSIIKALDFTAKFIRKSLKPHIGNRNITPAFLKFVETVLNGVARYLVREGYIEDMRVLNVKQDDISPDTIYIDVNIKVLYPVNYIKVTLIF